MSARYAANELNYRVSRTSISRTPNEIAFNTRNCGRPSIVADGRTFSNRLDEKQLRAAGFNDADIALVRQGKVPQGWQVHHKKPLDDGGDNSFDNLVLIKNDPYHQAITNEQKRLVGDLQPGDTRAVDFPLPQGSIYPPTR